MSSPSEYPLPLAVKNNLDKWLNSLEISMPPSTTDGETRFCSSCRSQLSHGDPIEGPGNDVLLLPCGCPWHRGCLKEVFGMENDNASECLDCGSQIFEEWTLSAWIKSLKVVPMAAVHSGEVEPECGICQLDYRLHKENDSEPEPEKPIVLPCKHVLGEGCLEKWLSPSEGGGNSCPICRRTLFPPWPSTIPLEETEIFGIFEEVLNDNEGLDDRMVETRRREESIYWVTFLLGHQELQHHSPEDAAADRQWLHEQLDDMERDSPEWVFEPRWQTAPRRGRIRGLLVSRMMERSRARSQILRH